MVTTRFASNGTGSTATVVKEPTTTPTPTKVEPTATPPVTAPEQKAVTTANETVNNGMSVVDRANLNVAKETGAAQVENKKALSEIDTSYNEYKAGTEAAAIKQKADAEKFAKDNEAIINKADAEINKIQQDQLAEAERQKKQQVDLLEQEKKNNTDYLKAQQEAVKIKNEQAIKAAEYNVEIERQQSAWAYQKLGLGFSSGIINQSQQIATQGISKIAEIKVNANLQDAEFTFKIADAGFQYTKEVNDTINSYADKVNVIKTEMKNRINETQKNLLLNSYNKNKSISEIENWARAELKNANEKHLDDVMKVRDRGIQLAVQLQQTVTSIYNQGKEKINTSIANGSLYSMTTSQLMTLAKNANMTLEEVMSIKEQAISQSSGKVAESIMGTGFVLGGIERNTVNMEVKRLIETGRPLQEAAEIAVKRVLANNPEYKKMKELEAAKQAKELRDAKKVAGTGTGSSSNKIKGSDMIKTIAADGTVKFTNRITGETITATEPQISLEPYNIQGPEKPLPIYYAVKNVPIKANVKDYSNKSLLDAIDGM